jgi:hypothetical protein
MANQASIQASIWRGYARAAAKLGAPYQFYRPHAGNFPGNRTVCIPVSLNAEDMKYGKPRGYAKATFYLLADGTHIRVGDYCLSQSQASLTIDVPWEDRFGGVIGESMAVDFPPPPEMFFIAAMQPLLPILTVLCNRTVSIGRVTAPAGITAPSYGGMTRDNATPYVKGIPCSIIQGTKGEKGQVNLPGDTRAPWWTILMPASVGSVKYGDLIIDDLGTRYVVSSSELTALGYRITAMMANA